MGCDLTTWLCPLLLRDTVAPTAESLMESMRLARRGKVIHVPVPGGASAKTSRP